MLETENGTNDPGSGSLERFHALVGQVRLDVDQLDPFGLPEEDGSAMHYIRQGTVNLVAKSQEAGLDLTDHKVRHDIRNLIGAVKGFAELLLLDFSDGPVGEKLLKLKQTNDELNQVVGSFGPARADVSF